MPLTSRLRNVDARCARNLTPDPFSIGEGSKSPLRLPPSLDVGQPLLILAIGKAGWCY